MDTRPVGINADPTLTLESIIERSEVAVVGIDGGGLDDLLGLAVIGREKQAGEQSARWLHWGHAWAHESVLERRKEIAPRLQDFAAQGDLTIVKRVGDDVTELVDFVMKLVGASLLPEKNAIGVDQVGIGAIVEEFGVRGLDPSPEAGIVVGIPQGWKLMNAIKTAERKLAGGELVHGGRPLMAWCVGNAKVEPKGNAIVITKQAAGTAKIDPLMALFNAVALMALNPQAAGRGIFEFYRKAAEETKPRPHAQPATVHLRAPPGVSNVYGLSGRQYLVGAGGVIQVTEADAKPLIGQGFAPMTAAEKSEERICPSP